MNGAVWTSDSTAYLAPGQGDAWAQQAQAASQVGTQRILDAGSVPAPAEDATAFGLAAGAPVIRRRRLILADERPVEIASSYYPTAIADGTALSSTGKIRGGAVTLLAGLGYRAVDVREDVSARHPSAEEVVILELPDTAAVLVLARVSVSADGTPFEYAVMVMSGGQHLAYRWQTGAGS